MNTTTLNMTTLDGNVIIKKGGGGTPINNQDKVVDITENGTIEVVADSGFTGLSKVTINVNIVDRTKAPNGVSIQHIDGTFYTANDWTAKGFSNDEANGVAVNTEECKFVMAKVQFDGIFWSSDSSNLVDGIFTTTTQSIARTDLAGPANTALMLATDTSGAAYVCSNYTFPNGAKGYLPALGEWYKAYLYKQEVDNAMMLIGGHSIPKYYHCWASTQFDATTGWGFMWNKGTGTGIDKKDEFYEGAIVRAFTSL